MSKDPKQERIDILEEAVNDLTEGLKLALSQEVLTFRDIKDEPLLAIISGLPNTVASMNVMQDISRMLPPGSMTLLFPKGTVVMEPLEALARQLVAVECAIDSNDCLQTIRDALASWKKTV